jgi:hypothetical protein
LLIEALLTQNSGKIMILAPSKLLLKTKRPFPDHSFEVD